MSNSIRPVCYQTDTAELIEVLQANLPYVPHAKFFEWLYHRNPAGQALTWVATDGSQRIIGAAAAFPRRFYCGSREACGFVLGDFCVDASHRSLGLALALQRACLDGITTSGAELVFDFPSRSMLAVYGRLGIAAQESTIRYAKPLRVDRKVAQRVPIGVAARGLSAVVNAGMQLRDTGLKPAAKWKIETEAGPWGEEFSEAAKRWSPAAGTCVARTAEYLNWRYREHPQRQYVMLAARGTEGLAGYLIYSQEGESRIIEDLLSEGDEASSALLIHAVEGARKSGVHTVDAPWLATHPGKQVVERCGFRARESGPVVLLRLPRGKQPQEAKGEWYLTNGDRES